MYSEQLIKEYERKNLIAKIKERERDVERLSIFYEMIDRYDLSKMPKELLELILILGE